MKQEVYSLLMVFVATKSASVENASLWGRHLLSFRVYSPQQTRPCHETPGLSWHMYTRRLFVLSVTQHNQIQHHLHANLARPNIAPYICRRISLSNKHDKAFMMYKALPVNHHIYERRQILCSMNPLWHHLKDADDHPVMSSVRVQFCF